MPEILSDSTTGVFVGLTGSDYGASGDTGAFSEAGRGPSFAAGRLAHVLEFQGPTLALDTACSSGGVALHLAVRARRSGECALALVGASHVLTSADAVADRAGMGMLAGDGHTKTFSSSADGFGPGEPAVVFIVERLHTTLAARRPTLGVIRGTATKHDGASAGLTAPNGTSQRGVIRTALEDAALAPHEVDYVECHGTGSLHGDSVEVHALGESYGERGQAGPLSLGGVKTRLGHTEAASAFVGVASVLAALSQESMPSPLVAGASK